MTKSVILAKSTVRRRLSWLTSPQAARFIGDPFFWLLGRRRETENFDLSEAKRVLVVRLDEIGDVVMTTPLLRELRRNLPGAWITLVVKPAVYNLVELCPYVNEVLTYDWNSQGRFWQLRRHGRALALAWKHLWRRRFDLAILPRWDTDHYHATFLTYFSGAYWRAGYPENVTPQKSRSNKGLTRLFTHLLAGDGIKHEVERNLDVIRILGGTVQDETLGINLAPEDDAFAEHILTSHHVHNCNLLVAFGPGAGSPKRMWPLSNFIELGRWLKKEYDARIIALGGRGEEVLGQELKKGLGNVIINLVGQTTLRQAGALLKHCQLYVGNDAGLMHIAAASNLPVVEISCHPQNGPSSHYNSPKRFGPWRVPHYILQPEKALFPCSDTCHATQPHCIQAVTVSAVKRSIVALLSNQDHSASHAHRCSSP